MNENLDTVERERERELYSSEISFALQAKKYIKIDKDRLFIAKVKNVLLRNSLSFLCVLEVMNTKDKYA